MPVIKKHRCLISAVAAILFLAPSAFAAQKNVLILHSYDQTTNWTDSIMQGMMDVFSGSDMAANIHVEYMDAVRHTSVSHRELLETYFQKKYSGYHFDVILVSDDPALEFILPQRELLFPGVPIVFCGANNFDESQIHGQTDITGINEDIDIKRTIQLALKIIPDIKQFLVLNDRSATGLLNRTKFEHAIAGFRGDTPSFEMFDDFTTAQLKGRLSGLPKDAAVLVIRLPAGGPGGLTSKEYLNFVSAHCRVPVFSLWGMDVDTQVLGGVMADGVEQGRFAAQYALRILQGEPVSSLPVVMESPNTAMVDYRQLKRLGIPEKAIPEGVQIRFKPETLYGKYRKEILGSFVFVALLLVIIVILYINIVIRKKTEKALLESEEKLSNALEMARLGHWEYDVAENLFKLSDHFYAIFHTTTEAAGGHTMSPDEYARRYVHPDDLHLATEEFKKAITTTDPHYNRRIEHRIRYADGTPGYMAVRFFIVKDDQGRTQRIYGVSQDITELRQAQQTVMKSEERWRMFLQTAIDGFSIVNSDGHFIEVNDAYCEILGYHREEILGKHISELYGIANIEDIKNRFQEIIRKGEDRFETKHRRKDGTLIDLEISVQYRQSLEGGLFTSILRDITERKQIESRLQQSQKMEAIGTLAGGIAHDFNNMLQPMLGFCELLQEDLPPDAPEQSYVNSILEAALRAKGLVNQILSFSRQEEEEARPTKIQPIIKETIKLLRSSIPKTIDIEQDIAPDCGIVFADPTQIYQIIMNLCTNAYHAMGNNGGALKLSLKQIRLEKQNPVFPEMTPGDYALLKIADTGMGIPRAIIDKIFDPYFTTKNKAKGTGLGLSIVRSIVKRYQGDIRIYSEPGKGTEIHVYLPIMTQGEGERDGVEGEPIMGGNERILLVDDEPPVAEMIYRMLERLGYRVSTRIGSMEALKTFQSSPEDFDLVITDLTMPYMTGIQLADEITRIRNGIPIILCTGFSEQAHQDKLNAVGICGVLTKPVLMKALSEMIRSVLVNGCAS